MAKWNARASLLSMRKPAFAQNALERTWVTNAPCGKPNLNGACIIAQPRPCPPHLPERSLDLTAIVNMHGGKAELGFDGRLGFNSSPRVSFRQTVSVHQPLDLLFQAAGHQPDAV